MKSTLICSWEGIAELEAEWNELLENSGSNTLFLTWEWINAWIPIAQQQGIQPYTVITRDVSGQLVGLAPLYLSKMRLLKFISLKTLRFMADVATGSEYSSFVARNGCEQEAFTSCVALLVSKRLDWDCLWISNCAAWRDVHSTFISVLKRATSLGFYTRQRDFCSIALPNSVEKYLASLSKSKRTDNKQLEKKLTKHDDVIVTACTSTEHLQEYLDDLYALHEARWKRRGEQGAFIRHPALRQFYQNLAPVALSNNWLRIYRLEVNGTPKAIQIGYAYDGVFSAIQEGFSPESHNGIGNYLRKKSIEYCIEEHLKEYDFLGGFSDHKRRWKAESRIGNDIFIWAVKPKNLLFSLREIWPSGRFLEHEIQK